MFRFSLTIFSSAFLLFQVQPLIARFILPWFGGTPAVWSTCMLFFQLILLAGYSYAHLLNSYLTKQRQAIVHLSLLGLACLLLPIIPNESLQPNGDQSPVFQILLVLSATIGLPYFVVSTTGPLLQSWFAKTYPGRSPYRLFALSNFGSLVALLTYPFVFEPYLRQNTQAISWSTGFGLFALLCGWCAVEIYRLPDTDTSPKEIDEDEKSSANKFSDHSKPNPWRVMLWIGLSMVPSILLLAVTNQVCQEIAVVPFLWIVPLALYLITFIICFEAPALYYRPVFYPMFAISMLLAWTCLEMGVDAKMWLQATGLISAFFFGSMVCHGELSCNKPSNQYLTLYYLAISVGGALGGIFVVLIAPNIFESYLELHVGLILAIVLTAIAFHARTENPFFKKVNFRISATVSIVLSIGLCVPFLHNAYTSIQKKDDETIVYRVRDFWGILTVSDSGSKEKDDELRKLLNGRINHGNQYKDQRWRLYKTTYYCEGSGVGLAVERHPKRQMVNPLNLKIGVIGLGTGTMAAWAEEGDEVLFYEINPEVKKVAEEFFFYLGESRQQKNAKVNVILGDARIQMMKQEKANALQNFDIIAVDAFSSDAIPRHLLTKECVELYQRHLHPDGIIAIHISNRFLDLEGICYRLGIELGYQPILINCNDPEDHWGYSNTWVLLTHSDEFQNDPIINMNRAEWKIEWQATYLEDFIKENGGNSKDSLLKEKEGLSQFRSSLSLDKKTEFDKLIAQHNLAEKQFDVLWTDDFGSLWQVIRLEFDLKSSWQDLKDWWQDSEDEEVEEED